MQSWPQVGSFGNPVGDQEAAIRRQLPGREPFIAPPSSTKSRYFANPILRQLWSDALGAIANARSIYIIGYSIPLQDQAAIGLLLEGIGGKHPDIRIVNPDHSGVLRNLAEIFVPDDRREGEDQAEFEARRITSLKDRFHISESPEISSVADFAKGYFDELMSDGVANLTVVANSLGPVFGLDEQWNGPDDGVRYPITGPVYCTGLPITGGVPTLICEEADQEGDALVIPVRGFEQENPRRITALIDKLQRCDNLKTIVARYDNGMEIPMVPSSLVFQPTPHLQGGNWYNLNFVGFRSPLTESTATTSECS